VEKTWLTKLYEDVGLPAEQAAKAADETLLRLLRRERPRIAGPQRRASLVDFLVRDPLVSMNRIIGRGDVGLPFYDDDLQKLSVVAFSNVLGDIGIDPVVALAYSKVVVEAFEVGDLYGPLWKALGKTGPFDLDELRRMDWSPLRTDVPVRASMSESTATAVTAVSVEAVQRAPAAASISQTMKAPVGRAPLRKPSLPQPKPKK
jgi:hypothetical protein